ncbi:MAG: hypothetical protein P4M02_06460 [Clostridia bacterium]|nr:hypothetical protein [Clostridia bacterium]
MDYLITIISLIVALASSIIALVAYRITKNAYRITCKEYEPLIDFVINERKQYLKIKNNSSDIFRISDIMVKGIFQCGFQRNTNSLIIKFEDFMIDHHCYLSDSKKKRTRIKFQNCRSSIKNSNSLFDYVQKNIDSMRDKVLNSQIDDGAYFPLSAMDAYIYIIDITYFDLNNRERKLYYLYKTERYQYDDWLKKYISASETEEIYDSIFDPASKGYLKEWKTVFGSDYKWSAEKE